MTSSSLTYCAGLRSDITALVEAYDFHFDRFKELVGGTPPGHLPPQADTRDEYEEVGELVDAAIRATASREMEFFEWIERAQNAP